jgi:Cu(I)/Ag(I) efflux system periplasmic protein CusF
VRFVPTLKWPAMTMAFKVSPELTKGLQTGQKVHFEFEAQGMSATITKIAVAK